MTFSWFCEKFVLEIFYFTVHECLSNDLDKNYNCKCLLLYFVVLEKQTTAVKFRSD